MFNPFDQAPGSDQFSGVDPNAWVSAPAAPAKGWLGPGLKAGLHELGGMSGSALQAAGKLVGMPGVERYGRDIAQSQNAAAAEAGRPDLEVAPWREGGAPWLPYIGYQVAKNAPQIGAQLLAGGAIGMGAKAAGVALAPAALENAGAYVPKLIGGGGLRAGATAAERAAAQAAGKDFAGDLVSNAIAGYPMGVGSMYQEAQAREDAGGAPVSKEDAAKAIGLGLPYAAMDALGPTQLKALARPVENAGAKAVVKHVLTTGAAGALEEMPQEALQTAMEQSFRSDLPVADKMRNVVDAALTGGLIGGVFGGGAGGVSNVRAIAGRDPNTVSTDELNARTAEVEGQPEAAPQAQPAQEEAPQPQRPYGAQSDEALAGAAANLAGEDADPEQLAAIAQEQQVRSRYAGHTDDQLMQAAQSLDLNDPEQAAQAQEIFGEMQTRLDREGSAAQPAAEAPAQTQAPSGGSVREQLDAFAPKQVRAKKDSAFNKNFPAGADDATTLGNLRAYFADGKFWDSQPKYMKEAMVEFGLADKNGRPVDEAIADLQAQIDKNQKRASRNPGAAKNVETLTAKRDALIAKKSIWSNLDAVQKQSSSEGPLRQGPEGSEGVRRSDAQYVEAPREGGQVGPEERAAQVGPESLRQGLEESAPAAPGEGRQEVSALQEGNGVSSLPPKSSKFERMAAASRAYQAQTPQEAGIGVLRDATPEEIAAATAERQRMWDELDAQKKSGGNDIEIGPGTANDTVMPEEPKFRAASEPVRGTGLSDTAFDRTLDNTLKSLGPQLRDKVVVVAKAADLPQEVKDSAARQNIPLDNVNGVNAGNKVYIVRGAHAAPADIQNTLRHEILGHGGVKALFGKDAVDTLSSLYDRVGIGELYKAAKGLGVDPAIAHYIPKGKTLYDLSQSEKADLVDELLAQVSGGTSDETIEAAAGPQKGKVRQAIEKWVGKLKDALVSALDKAGFKALAARYKTYSPQQMASLLREAHAAVRASGELDNIGDGKFSVKDVNDKTKEVVGDIVKWANNIPTKDYFGRFRRSLMGWMSVFHINQHYGSEFGKLDDSNPVTRYMKGKEFRDTVLARMAQLADEASRKMEVPTKAMKEHVMDLMNYTAYAIDPAKDWDAHTWLHGLSNEPVLKELVKEANAQLRSAKQMKDKSVLRAYEAAKSLNATQRYAAAAVMLHEEIAGDRMFTSIPIAKIDPMDEFLKSSSHHSLASAEKFWAKAFSDRMEQVQAFLTKARKDREMNKAAAKLRSAFEASVDMKQAMDRAPYFHLGRQGDYMVAFPLLKDADGNVDQAAVDKLSKLFDKHGFGDVAITHGQNVARAFIRLDTIDEATNLALLLDANRDLLGEGEIKHGNRTDEKTFGKLTTQAVDRFLDQLKASLEPDDGEELEDSEKAKQRLKQQIAVNKMRSVLMDLMPDNAAIKVLSPRDSVPGYSKNLYRSFAFRANVGANALANMSASRQITDAFSAMRGVLDDAKNVRGGVSRDPFLKRDVFSELRERELDRPYSPEPTWLDSLRAWNFAFYLGMSPSYAFLNMTQLGALTLPELAKRHGFVKSAGMLAKMTPAAFRIIQETAKSGWSVSKMRAADAIITADVLEKALPGDKNAKMRETVMRAVNRGNIDLSSAARELARAAEGRTGSTSDNIQRLASSFGYYSETASRLISAMAAAELHGGEDIKKIDDYADNIVNETMLNYSNWNTARQIGKKGILGEYSPLAFSFMNYQMQVLEKLYREFYNAVAASDPEAKKEARKFLASHAAAMVAISGTLGLPGAAFAAGAFDKLKDLFEGDDDEPSDIQAAYRDFLAQTFGKDVGELIAHGGFRAAGFDIAQRAGEQDILPFTKLMTDRRKLEDRIGTWIESMGGSPYAMGKNILKGSQDFANGDLIGGAKEFLPVAFKGPLEAYRMTQDGYVDKQGRALPMTPGARDVLVQALGLTPANKAEYSEDNHARAVKKDVSLQRAGVIRTRLATAMESGDQEAIATWSETARRFDAAHPGYEVMPTIGSTVGKRAKAANIANTFHVPLGTSPKDLRAAQATDWANWR